MTLTPQSPVRRMRGFEPASTLLREPIRKAGEARGFPVMRLLTHWQDVAGEALAADTRPVKVGYGREGMGATLTLLVKPAMAPMVQMQLPALKDRINACYGYSAISRISLTQTAPTGFSEGQAEFIPAAVAAKAPDPELTEQARENASGIGDASLRDALARLGENVLTRTRTTDKGTR